MTEKLKTINLTPTWEAITPVILDAYGRHAATGATDPKYIADTNEAMAVLKAELVKAAKLADLAAKHIELIELAEELKYWDIKAIAEKQIAVLFEAVKTGGDLDALIDTGDFAPGEDDGRERQPYIGRDNQADFAPGEVVASWDDGRDHLKSKAWGELKEKMVEYADKKIAEKGTED